mmetsp:Transcript_23082/g.52560  ORF Transcript_23082/g.52560 Transcript_23082/m.52560 type:complete len:133 (+) Transcript_23082:83-481(+)
MNYTNWAAAQHPDHCLDTLDPIMLAFTAQTVDGGINCGTIAMQGFCATVVEACAASCDTCEAAAALAERSRKGKMCALFSPEGQWYSVNCEAKLPLLCFRQEEAAVQGSNETNAGAVIGASALGVALACLRS